MKLTKSLVLGAASLVALTGCVFAPAAPAEAPTTAPTVQTATPEVETTEPTPEVTAPSADEVFLTVVRDELPWTQQESDADLIALGQQVCQTVGNIGFEETIYSLAMDETMTEQEVLDLSFIVGAAVGAYCPEYLD